MTCGPLSHHLADLYTHLTDPFLHHVGPWESWTEQTTLINAVAASPQWIEGAVLDSPLVIPVHQKFRFILDGLMVSATPIHKLTFIVSSDLFNPTTTVVWETIFDPRATGITLPFHAESGPLTLLPDNQYILSAYADGAGVTGGGILGTSLTPFGFRLVALP